MGMIIFLPLGNIPVSFRVINTLHSLPLLCCLIGICLVFIENRKNDNLENTKTSLYGGKYKYFFLLYVGWPIFCILIGSVRYPYFYEINMINVPWMKQLQDVFSFAGKEYIDSICSAILFMYRDIKEELFPMGAGIALVFHLYKNNWKRGVKMCIVASTILASFCILYSIPEMIWLWTNNTICELILRTVNVYLYDVPLPPAWHPPLLWNGQLRSLFDEPSSLGIISSFIYPMLFLIPCDRHRYYIGKVILISIFFLMILMTQSRTAVGVLIGEFLLLGLYLGVIKRKGLLIILFLTAFIGTFIYNAMPILINRSEISKQIEVSGNSDDYMTRNIISIASTDKRSNNTRYGMTVAAFRVGIQHPIFGVGRGYESLYMEMVLPEFAKENKEINEWMENSRSKGITQMGCFILNQYMEEFAASGIIGLIIFVMPPFYIIYKVLKKRLFHELTLSVFIISLLGQLAAMCSGPYWYTYPIVLGLLLCFINDQSRYAKMVTYE
ncbi:MAG: O-antigen ligase family protein [Dialister invisus]|uniref:O-antigen ligase family protein n=1 Tax=Dialister invisus TaxID=218538 RepID=UPI002F91E2E8